MSCQQSWPSGAAWLKTMLHSTLTSQLKSLWVSQSTTGSAQLLVAATQIVSVILLPATDPMLIDADGMCVWAV